MSPKVNIIAWLESEFAYFEGAVHHFNHYAMGDSTGRNDKNCRHKENNTTVLF